MQIAMQEVLGVICKPGKTFWCWQLTIIWIHGESSLNSNPKLMLARYGVRYSYWTRRVLILFWKQGNIDPCWILVAWSWCGTSRRNGTAGSSLHGRERHTSWLWRLGVKLSIGLLATSQNTLQYLGNTKLVI